MLFGMKQKTKAILSLLILAISLIIISSTIWIINTFQIEGFESFLFTILMPTTGTSKILIFSGIFCCLLIPLFIIALIIFINKILSKNNNAIIIKITKTIKRFSLILSFLLLTVGICFFFIQLEVPEHINNQINKSTIYEDKYIDPRGIDYSFPETKRNLIFISLESMETSFYDKANGGALDINVIPELFDLATNGQCFTKINNQGYHVAPGTSWTIASHVGALCGVPIGNMFINNRNFEDGDFLPGAYGIGDILENNGYNTVYMCGENAGFASTDDFFKLHGNFEIMDWGYAVESQWIEDWYCKNWGYEDDALFMFAQNELVSLSQQGKPFFLFLSTMDTHSPDGYVCGRCENNYESQMLNVLRCSSNLVNEFIDWIKQQDFYENTTIVIMGDHISMSITLKNLIDKDYVRKPYFTIINSAIQDYDADRLFSTFDIFPTTLTSLGIKYKSDRLALGTNLYSDTSTLIEEMGYSFFEEVSKTSKYYTDKIVLNK